MEKRKEKQEIRREQKEKRKLNLAIFIKKSIYSLCLAVEYDSYWLAQVKGIDYF